MNKFYTFLAAILLTISTFAQAPEKMSYQAVIRNSGDALVTNQAVGMRISILQGSASGAPVYVETQTPTTNINGLVSLEIGTGTPVTGTFAGIDWATGPYFIKTETDPTGSTTYTITGTSQLMSVPYALYAKTSGGCTYSVGDFVPELGGYIFYLDGSGCHGLVAKTQDEPSVYQWSEFSFRTYAFASGIFGGAQNTKKSIARAVANGSTCPAAIQASLTDGGFNDWYLPSIDELDMMYVNLHLQGLAGFAANYYWSSTEFDTYDAWNIYFGNGNSPNDGKNNTYTVRAVRAF